MTPQQIAIVESTISFARADLTALAAEFYRRLFAAEPALRDLFESEPNVQVRKFADQLDALAHMVRDFDAFTGEAAALGLRHREYGVQARHYALAGPPLAGALASMLGAGWTPDVETAWVRAYNLMVEVMMAGAAGEMPGRPAR
jgi:hemoglobin-like flavoprotein